MCSRQRLQRGFQGFTEAGWTTLHAAPEYGGQGLPKFHHDAGGDPPPPTFFGLYPGLTSGCLQRHQRLRQRRVEQRFRRKWWPGSGGGDVPDEPHCGTDLGMPNQAEPCSKWQAICRAAARCSLLPASNDPTENIIHLVLARTPARRRESGVSASSWCPRSGCRTTARWSGPTASAAVRSRRRWIHASSTCVIN